MNKVYWLIFLFLLHISFYSYGFRYGNQYQISYSNSTDGVTILGTIERSSRMANRYDTFTILLEGEETSRQKAENSNETDEETDEEDTKVTETEYEKKRGPETQCTKISNEIEVCDTPEPKPDYENFWSLKPPEGSNSATWSADPMSLYHPLDFLELIKAHNLGARYTIALPRRSAGVAIELTPFTATPGPYYSFIGPQRLTALDLQRFFNDGGGKIITGHENNEGQTQIAYQSTTNMQQLLGAAQGSRGFIATVLPALAKIFMNRDEGLQYYGFMTTSDEEHLTKARAIVLPIPHMCGSIDAGTGISFKMSVIQINEITPTALEDEGKVGVLVLHGHVVYDPNQQDHFSPYSEYNTRVKLKLRKDMDTGTIFQAQFYFLPEQKELFATEESQRKMSTIKRGTRSVTKASNQSQFIEFTMRKRDRRNPQLRVQPNQRERVRIMEGVRRYLGCCFEGGSS